MATLLAKLLILTLLPLAHAAPKKKPKPVPAPAAAAQPAATRHPDAATELFVDSALCSDPSKLISSSATPIRLSENKSYLVAAAPDMPEGAKFCHRVRGKELPSPLPLRLVHLDHGIGFAAYELPAALEKFAFPLVAAPGRDMNSDSLGRLPEVFGLPIKLQPSDRHHFSGVYSVSQSASSYDPDVFEGFLVGGKDERFFHGTGTPVLGGWRDFDGKTRIVLYGILSDQSVITLPGEPARVYRQRDLRLLRVEPPLYFRVVLSPAILQSWLGSAIEYKQKLGELVFMRSEESETANRTEWSLGGKILTETCFRPGAIPANLNIPVGGIKPEGVGGLEDVLSHCRFTMAAPRQAAQSLLVAFRWTGGKLVIKSPQNAHDLLSYERGNSWTLLFDGDKFKPDSLPQLQKLRTAALDAREKTAAFHRARQGDPLSLRRAYVLATLALNGEWDNSPENELSSLLEEIRRGDLRETEAWDTETEIAPDKLKQELLDSLEKLGSAWTEARRPVPLTDEEIRKMFPEKRRR